MGNAVPEDLEARPNLPVQPKVVIGPDDVVQPRTVEWGHLTAIRGSVSDGQVHIHQQGRMHSFETGLRDSGQARHMFDASIEDALDIYRALDALFTGGVGEVDHGE